MTRCPARRLSSALQGGFLFSEVSRIVFGRNERVRICNTSTKHKTVESIIFHESNPLTTFCKVRPRLPGHYFEPLTTFFFKHTQNLTARGVAIDLLQMAKRVGLQCEAAEHGDLSGKEDFSLDIIVVDD